MSKGSTATQQWLTDNPQHNRVELLAITLQNGEVIRAVMGTNANIIYDGVTWYSAANGTWSRGPISGEAAFRPKSNSFTLKALMATDPAYGDVVYYPNTTTTLLSCVNAGLFNGARVVITELFWALGTAHPTSGGYTFTLTVGNIGGAKSTDRSTASFDVFDMLYILNRPFPPHNIQSQCRHVLGDYSCTVDLANFTSTPYTLDASSTTLYLNIPVPLHATGTSYTKGNLVFVEVSSVYYLFMCFTGGTSAGSAPTFNYATLGQRTTDGGVSWMFLGSCASTTNSANQGFPLGFLTFTSGNNDGLQGSIKIQVVVTSPSLLLQLQLGRPMPLAVSNTDTVVLTCGCNKSLATCGTLFAQANSGRAEMSTYYFAGMPFVPSPETAGV
jgi:hypothetical protein